MSTLKHLAVMRNWRLRFIKGAITVISDMGNLGEISPYVHKITLEAMHILREDMEATYKKKRGGK